MGTRRSVRQAGKANEERGERRSDPRAPTELLAGCAVLCWAGMIVVWSRLLHVRSVLEHGNGSSIVSPDLAGVKWGRWTARAHLAASLGVAAHPRQRRAPANSAAGTAAVSRPLLLKSVHCSQRDPPGDTLQGWALRRLELTTNARLEPANWKSGCSACGSLEQQPPGRWSPAGALLESPAAALAVALQPPGPTINTQSPSCVPSMLREMRHITIRYPLKWHGTIDF